jgi:sulfane dehydrogenase subunit SoxC
LTPLQDLTGTITPADLHFTRIHAGVPTIDPAKHTLLIHGLVDRPVELSVADLKRFPAVTRVHFIECSGNGRAAYRTPKPEMTPQQVDGMMANSEWTGVPLSVLFRQVGVKPQASWFLAEGGDAALLDRSIPVSKGRDDALVAWAQNGEALRPEQGFPIRLLLPGYEGNANVKWLRRIKLGAEPFMTRWETSKYTDPLPADKARMFSFEMDAKSIITSPAYPERLPAPGWWPIRGLAWSGRGRITRVDVSTDGGKTWLVAQLLTALTPKAHVRFEHMWQWDGNESLLMSRATDDQGYVQPTMTQLKAVRGAGTDYHFNSIRAWRVARDGVVTFEANT